MKKVKKIYFKISCLFLFCMTGLSLMASETKLIHSLDEKADCYTKFNYLGTYLWDYDEINLNSDAQNLLILIEYGDMDLMDEMEDSNSWISIHATGPGISIEIEQNDTMTDRFYTLVYGSEYDDCFVHITITQESCGQNWYLDSDGDGFGDYHDYEPIVSCSAISGRVLNKDDFCPDDFYATNNGCHPSYENSNWTTNKVYDINGNLKANSKSYFDELGKGIQSQSVDIKTGRIWASQTMYDSQGRPALSTLSAPIGQTSFAYKTDFIKNNNGNIYTTSDFETTPEDPNPVNNDSNTVGWYYSDANTDAFHSGNSYQDITSYPFSRTVYSDLNPGAVRKVIGGNKVDSNNDGQEEWISGHTFSMKAGQELAQSVAFGDAKYNDYKIIKTVSRDVHGIENVVFIDTDGKVLAAARVGGTPKNYDNTITIGEQGYVDVHVPIETTGFSIAKPTDITIEVYDLISEQINTTTTTSLPAGFYRVAITNIENYNPDPDLTNTLVQIVCKDNYYDYSLNEYSKSGQLIDSYQPQGTSISTKPKSKFQYNALGQLIYTKSPDEGEAWFKYRNDGQIRYSQNSKQVATGEFSYTNYDSLGRPVESGVLVSNEFSSALPDYGLPAGTKNEVQHTTYDALESTDETFLNTLNVDYREPTFLASNVVKTSNDNTTTYYSYDVYGRVQWMVQNITGLGVKTIDYEYDPITSAVTKVYFQKNDSNERFIHKYTYDTDTNQLVKVETSTDDAVFITHANYEYYESGALKRTEIADGIQGIDYVYNLSGQLKNINHPELNNTNDPGNDANDLFGLSLNYYDNDYQRPLTNVQRTSTGQDQFNGNIKNTTWNTNMTGTVQNSVNYSYTYNRNNWLTEAVFDGNGNSQNTAEAHIILNTLQLSDNTVIASQSITLAPGFATGASNFTARIDAIESTDYKVSNITYDANGNIQTLARNKNTENGSNEMDNFTYNYKTGKPNQLDHVQDAVTSVTNANDLKSQTAGNYVYNSIGQLTENKEEDIKYVYNAAGLVTEVQKNNVPLVKFFYNDKGHRVRKEAYVSGSLSKTEYYVRDAAGSVLAIYNGTTQTEVPIYGANRLGMFYRNEGTPPLGEPEGDYVYQLTDHLGNIRAVIAKEGSNAVAITSATDYYPAGMAMPNRKLTDGSYRYDYQGQELDQETGKVAFKLRLYDPRINRWLTTDPARQYASPYLSMGNNWVSRVDPDGGEDWVPDENGNLVAQAGDNDQTLADYMGISLQDAQNMIATQGLFTDFNTGQGTDLLADQTLTLDNVFTRSIANSSSDFTLDRALAGTSVTGKVPEDNYNCWGSACAGSQGIEIQVGVGIRRGATFDSNLINDYSPVGSNLQFGKTVIRFADGNNNVQHGAVYYGTSQNGTVYVYTKNGWELKPEIMKLTRVNNSSILEYGTVKGIQSIHTGYYNPN